MIKVTFRFSLSASVTIPVSGVHCAVSRCNLVGISCLCSLPVFAASRNEPYTVETISEFLQMSSNDPVMSFCAASFVIWAWFATATATQESRLWSAKTATLSQRGEVFKHASILPSATYSPWRSLTKSFFRSEPVVFYILFHELSYQSK